MPPLPPKYAFSPALEMPRSLVFGLYIFGLIDFFRTDFLDYPAKFKSGKNDRGDERTHDNGNNGPCRDVSVRVSCDLTDFLDKENIKVNHQSNGGKVKDAEKHQS